jgi:peroxiredoxin
LTELERRYDELRGLGVDLVALSVDPPLASAALARQLGLSFPILCDVDRQVIRELGMYNAKEKGGIAFPGTFVIDRERTLRFRSLDRTASRLDLTALFAFLHAGVGSAAPAEPPKRGAFPGFVNFGRAIANSFRFGSRSREN